MLGCGIGHSRPKSCGQLSTLVMTILVKVKTHAKKIGIKAIDQSHYEIAVNALPIDGKANQEVIQAFADHFNIPKSQVRLKSGHKSKVKIFNLDLADVQA